MYKKEKRHESKEICSVDCNVGITYDSLWWRDNSVAENETTPETTVDTEVVETEPVETEPETEPVVITDEQVAAVKESNKAYRNLLKDQMAFGDCWPGRAFGVKDIDGNGIDEVIVRTSMNEEDSPGTIVSYINGKICFGFDSWVNAAIYYCPSTGCFIAKEGSEPNASVPNAEWGGTLHEL